MSYIDEFRKGTNLCLANADLFKESNNLYEQL